MLIVHGANASPFVRKVRALLAEKGVAHESEMVFPGDQSPDWRRISPLGKIPLLQDGDDTELDSSARGMGRGPRLPNQLDEAGSRASHFVNLEHAKVAVDAGRRPKFAAPVRSVLSRPSFESLVEEERALFG
jgi:hypothetical protein